MSDVRAQVPLAYAAAGRDTEYAGAARRLAVRLARLAVVDRAGRPSWSGDDVDPSSPTVARLVHGTLDEGLLTGRAGIAVALSGCSRLPGAHPGWGRLAVAAAAASLEATAAALARATGSRDDGVPGSLGRQSGAFGVAEAAALVGRQQGVPALVESARDLASRALRLLRDRPSLVPDYPDLLDGTAGHLLAVLAADVAPGEQDLRMAMATDLARRLLDAAVEEPDGLRWAMAGTMPSVCGLAHGGSGAALALAEAAAVGVPGALRQAAAAAVRWEAARYDVGGGVWPDLRAEPPVPALAWCHGGPGIGIAAARIHALDGDPLAMVALGRAQRGRPSAAPTEAFDATLCHGLGGWVELSLVSAEQLPAAADEHLRTARRLARWVTRAGAEGAPGWTCGLPEQGLTPSVLVGVAGVAWTLVRCHDPALLPSAALPGPGGRPGPSGAATG